MRHILTRNLGWKLLALAISVLLWVAVAREPEVATSLSVPVEFRNIPENVDIEGTLPERIQLEVRGPSGRLTRENLAAAAVVLDLSDAQPGERTYGIRSRYLNLPRGVVFYKAVPSQLTVRFDQLSVKEEPVQPVFVNLPAGFRVAIQELSPAVVRIRGSQARIENIHGVKTDPLNLAGLDGEKTFQTHMNVGDPQIRILDIPTDVSVSVKLEKMKTSNGVGR